MFIFTLFNLAHAAPALELAGDAFTLERTELCLPSGLRIIYQQEPQHPTVTITSVIGTGSTADPEGMEGLAHLMEHLWFRSHAVRPDMSVWDMASRLGGSINGSTTPDATDYTVVAPKSRLGVFMAMEAARVVDPLKMVTEETFQTEREVVRSELRWRYENSSGQGYLALLEVLFDEGHPYHRPTIGTHESLDAITFDAVRQFAAQHYVPSNTTWVITAPQSLDEFRETLAKRLPAQLVQGSASCSGSSPLATEPGPPSVEKTVRVDAFVSRPMAMIAWSLPAGYGARDAQIERTTELLERSLWRFGASCSSRRMWYASMAWCAVPLPSKSATQEQYLDDVLDDVSSFWDTGQRHNSEYRYRQELIDQQANLFNTVERLPTSQHDAHYIHLTGRMDWLGSRFRQVQGAKFEVDAKFAARWFDQRRAVRVILKPRSQADAQPNRHAQASASTQITAGTVVDEKKIRDASRVLDLSQLRKKKLANGLEVWVLPYGRAPFARATLMMDGGWAQAPSAAVESLKNFAFVSLGDAAVQGAQLAYAPVRVGGDWFITRSSLTTEYGIRGTAGKLDAMLYLLRQRIENGRLDMAGKAELREAIADAMWDSWAHPATWGRMQRSLHLTGTHDEWDPSLLDEMASTKRGDVERWVRKIFRPTGNTLIIVGRVDPDRALALAETWFGDFKDRSDGSAHTMTLKPHTPPARRVVVLEERSRQGALVELECDLGEDSLQASESQTVLSSAVRSIAKTRLRSQRGATYGVSSSLDILPNRHTGLYVSTDVTSDAAGTAVRTLLDSLSALAKQTLAPTVIEHRKLELARRSGLRLRNSQEASNKLRSARRQQFGLEYITDFPDRLAAVDAKAVAGLLPSCVGHEIVTVRGQVAPIVSSLNEAKVKHEVLDWSTERDEAMKHYDPRRYRKQTNQ